MTEEMVNDKHTDNSGNGMSTEDKQRAFALYFEGLDRIEVPYGLNELIKKAKELGLPIPSRKEAKSWKRKL